MHFISGVASDPCCIDHDRKPFCTCEGAVAQVVLFACPTRRNRWWWTKPCYSKELLVLWPYPAPTWPPMFLGQSIWMGWLKGASIGNKVFFLTPHDQGLRFRLSLQILGMSDVFVVSCGHKVGESDVPSSLAGGSQGWPTATPDLLLNSHDKGILQCHILQGTQSSFKVCQPFFGVHSWWNSMNSDEIIDHTWLSRFRMGQILSQLWVLVDSPTLEGEGFLPMYQVSSLLMVKRC